MEIEKLRLGGVPEHFNLPIHLAIENNEFLKRSIDVQWTSFGGGTGQMIKALRENQVDACILLTEGIILDILKGNPSKLISNYVITPLIWGIHTGKNNKINTKHEIYDKQYAISRYGSGSHLMAIVDANINGKNLNHEQFSVINNLDGALQSLSNLETDVFYWEKYTTKPFVDKNIVKRIAEFITPWPCFVIAATNKILEEKPTMVIRMLRTIHDSCDSFMQKKNVIDLVSRRYKLKPNDVERWFYSTEWAIHGWVSDKMLQSVVHNLSILNLVDYKENISELVWKR